MLDRRAHARESGVGVRPTVTQKVRAAAIWKTPRSSLFVILTVEALCVTWVALAGLFVTTDLGDLGRFGLLLAVNLVYAEGNARIERLSRFVGANRSRMSVNAVSLWAFAAVLILPLSLAGVFTVIIYLQVLVTAVKARSGQPFRVIYTGTTEVAATLAAGSVVAAFGGASVVLSAAPISLVAVVIATLVYTSVNQVLLLTVVYLVRRPIGVRSLISDADSQLMEFATLGLGVLFAVAIVHAPYLSPLSLIVIVVIRRSALVRQLQEQATRDGKTGLLNASAWRHEADREIVRSERLGGAITVLMVDLDHFKRLNDEFGHQAGDVALKAVADVLKDALRGYDAVGRFGGEEFIALLSGADRQVCAVVAERLRARIEAIALPSTRVTASIGVGIGSPGIHHLDELIAVADKALYVAKRSGRNRVHISEAPAASVAWPPSR